jgi:predicted nuclease of predicted toxin-antitoxin system
MLRLAADENFNGDIVRGLLRRNPKLDIVRVQDVGLSGADDPSVLKWAADQGRIVVTHDISTLAKHLQVLDALLLCGASMCESSGCTVCPGVRNS